MTSILFVCSANRFRSVIAEASFKSLVEKDLGTKSWNISSAGTWATNGLPPLPQAITLAEKLGLDISSIRSREVDKAILENSSIVIVMTESQRESIILEFQQTKQKIYLFSEMFAGEAYDVPDLYERVDETPESIGVEINSLITTGYGRFVGAMKKLGIE